MHTLIDPQPDAGHRQFSAAESTDLPGPKDRTEPTGPQARSVISADGELKQELLDRLGQIKCLVQACLSNNAPVVVWRQPAKAPAYLCVNPAWVGHYKALEGLLEAPKLRYSRSLWVDLFERCVQAMGLLGCHWYGPNPSAIVWQFDPQGQCFVERLDGKRYGELFQDLVVMIRREGCQPAFRQKVRQQALDARRNYDSALAYNERLFECRSRLVAIRLDLGYRREVAQTLTLQRLDRDLDRFFCNQRHNRLFKHLYGYVIKVEEGPLRGLHTHVVLYFLGSEVQKHEHLGDLIGRYWVEQITEGRGSYFNCNRIRYKYVGVGVIEHDDHEKRKHLRERVLGYLFKDDQHVQIKGCRVFRRGVMPALPTTPMGRPRRQEFVAA